MLLLCRMREGYHSELAVATTMPAYGDRSRAGPSNADNKGKESRKGRSPCRRFPVATRPRPVERWTAKGNGGRCKVHGNRLHSPAVGPDRHVGLGARCCGFLSSRHEHRTPRRSRHRHRGLRTSHVDPVAEHRGASIRTHLRRMSRRRHMFRRSPGSDVAASLLDVAYDSLFGDAYSEAAQATGGRLGSARFSLTVGTSPTSSRHPGVEVHPGVAGSTRSRELFSAPGSSRSPSPDGGTRNGNDYRGDYTI